MSHISFTCQKEASVHLGWRVPSQHPRYQETWGKLELIRTRQLAIEDAPLRTVEFVLILPVVVLEYACTFTAL